MVIHGALAELVEGTFLLRRQAGKNLLHWFESNTLRQVLVSAVYSNRVTSLGLRL